MEPILLKLMNADGTYRDTFADYIFESFAAPEAIYRALLKHLRKYGVALTDLNSDMTRCPFRKSCARTLVRLKSARQAEEPGEG